MCLKRIYPPICHLIINGSPEIQAAHVLLVAATEHAYVPDVPRKGGFELMILLRGLPHVT